MTHAEKGATDLTVPFGGLNIILMGDFHQFLPVDSSTLALYCPPQQCNTLVVGKNLYEQFEMVVNFNEQIRITDQV